jgi:hypothetical protein
VFDTTEAAVRSFQISASPSSVQNQPWYATPQGLADLKAAS